MPDITMCKGDGCGVRDNCYRYTAKPDKWQSYFAKPPRDEKSCLWIMPLRDESA